MNCPGFRLRRIWWVLPVNCFLLWLDLLGAATLFQKPTVNESSIVFEYAGDLWSVSRAGGVATRLTVSPGAETDPRFSPDGRRIAFTGQYDGNTDVFVIPAEGGVPLRLTYHPGDDMVAGWTPDGKKILFASSRTSPSFYPKLFTVGIEGGAVEELPLPMGERGSFSPDGTRLAYEPLTQWQPEWKRYRGGQMDKIWVADLKDSSVELVPRENSSDRFPMWVGNSLYFLSDRDGRYTLYSYNLGSKRVERLLQNEGLDLKSASAWAGDGARGPVIAYEQFGEIHLYDIRERVSRKVDIKVTGDLMGVRARLEKVGGKISSYGISPTGARAVFAARGEILTVPADKGDFRNLTNSPGINERDPAWSPDGRWIAYFSDESGEYVLHIRDQKGGGEVKKISLPPTFYETPVWSPDSRLIAFTNKKLELFYVNPESGSPILVDRNPFGLRSDLLDPVWSPDSKWIAYVRQLDNRLRAVFLYSVEESAAHQVTDGMSDARYVAFDRSGKYLYFTASTNLGPAFSFAEMSTMPYQTSRSVYATVLRSDIPSPLAPESDEERIADASSESKGGKSGSGAPESLDKSTDSGSEAEGSDPKTKKPEPTKVDLDGIQQRIVALPIPSLNFTGLYAGGEGRFFVMELPPVSPAYSGPLGGTLHKFDLQKRKFEKVREGLAAFTISANGEKALFRTQSPEGGTWMIAPLAAMANGDGRGSSGDSGDEDPVKTLKTSDLSVLVDPKAEWQEMYHEIWRGERDFFYDPNAHGLNLKAAEQFYRPYLEVVAHRSDLNYLFTEMLNQLSVGHMFIGGGDIPRPEFVPGGLLGCDYEVSSGRYRIRNIFDGESWNPDLRAPLTQPGVNVKAGDYLLAVDGREVTASDSVYRFFEGKADRQVVIRVGPNADGADARDVTVVPVRSEAGLRNRDWIEGNRRKVDELSGGRLAYVYVPDTSGEGYQSFNRYFFSQTQKVGAVIDERFNQGGSLADYIVEYLTRPQLNMIYFRDGRDIPTPLGAIYGPKAMLINELAGSGGDALPWYFRKMKVGPLIGKRTWGGLIASFRLPDLLDGGYVTAPNAAIYGLEGAWEVENVGVGPDIEVDLDPAQWRQGRDPQLERAVQYLLEQLKDNPPKEYRRPDFPDYHKNDGLGN